MSQLPEESLYIDPCHYGSNHQPTKYPTNQGDHYLIRPNEETKEELCKPAFN
jgi:hypothetical protein